jgi:hypothetical protein
VAEDPRRGRRTRHVVRRVRVRLWPSAVAVVIAGVAYALLPDRLREGPRWLLPVLVLLLVATGAGSRWRGYERITPWIGRALTVLVTIALVASVTLLVTTLPNTHTPGRDLLAYAVLLWILNIVVFALWYWEIDGGGPHARHPGLYKAPDFSWPQFQIDPDNASSYWMPAFIDYLFLAFNTSTAFGPTDTMILSRPAKVLMMTQSGLALVILALLAARAINML